MASSASGTPTSSTSPSSASTCLSTGAICGIASSPGTLYLFTFLSTLLLLSIVAGGIVSRSVYLRRRQQRLMATGAWAPPSRRAAMTLETSLRKKPTMYEADLSVLVVECDLRCWESVKPLAAAYRPPAVRPIPVPPEVVYAVDDAAALGESIPAQTRIFSRARQLLRSTDVESNPAPPLPEPIVTIPLREASRNLRLQAAYVIAMPTEYSSTRNEGDQEWEGTVFRTWERGD
ncbi:hypothetical protein C8F04DRAFT_1240078 [Mycena alexandri]|uniref:Uncharacterized protein n=1 Tax=Mycena alexandri TaxID=1745969 RepID=A0AAD6S9N4_9AGAR|nr:hypothetical protein C8F04DRAFT_1240078 [Mycena alexandri]